MTVTLPNFVPGRRLDAEPNASPRNYHFELYLPGDSADIPLNIRPVRRHTPKTTGDLDDADRLLRNRRRLQDNEAAARARIVASASAYAIRHPGWVFTTTAPDASHLRLWCLAVPSPPGSIYGNRIVPADLPSYAITYEVPSPIPDEPPLQIAKINGAWDALNVRDPVATFGRLIDRFFATGALEPERTVHLLLRNQVAATRAGRYALLESTK